MAFIVMIVLVVLLIVQYVRLKDLRKREAQTAGHVQALEQQLFRSAQVHAVDLDKRAARAVAASRGSFDGHVAQQAFPYAPQHGYHPKDVFHFGGVIDYIVFDGLHDIRHGDRDPGTLTVVFADVKWGSSRPTDVQTAVVNALNERRTRGEIWQARESPAGVLDYRRKANLPRPQTGD